ncbi:ABC transporter permease [Mycolicibacter minnesotensis]|uniref:ABC transporter permease n=1 Tax=Mycolicibacter minnesotensis TaxID=1118379 RepID=A0A7I7R3C1_9MYCO|nr:FtsX-like permease family protein [Mycolicibacter minnesotensis]ORA99762.1 ABC transporter permease [Mycolicibacter minnesotensis]BBY32942.1 permease [Mycolicibacter minnesotensis]
MTGALAATASRLRLLSLRELLVHRRRTLAAITVMAVSSMYLVAVLGIFGSITGSVTRLSDGIAGIASLEVSGVTDAGFPASVAVDVVAVPGVATAAPLIRTAMSTPTGTMLLFGADASSVELAGALADALAHPPGGSAKTPGGVQVGPSVGHARGDGFRLGTTWVTVSQVLTGKHLADLNGGNYILAPLALAQNITGRTGQLDSILITTKPGTDLAAVRTAVAAAVDGRAVVAEPRMRATRAGDGVRLMNYMALMGAAVALVVGAFLVYTTMTMAITQRRPVISTLRAIGGRRATIVADLIGEAAVLGVLGGALGAALGIFLGHLAIRRLPPAITQGLEARVEYWLPGYALPVAVAATVLASVTAAAMAARQVYKVSPIEALAPVGASAADAVPRRLRIVSGIAAVVVIAVSLAIVVAHRGTTSLAAMMAVFCAEITLGFALTAALVTAAAAAARVFGTAGAVGAATIERAPRRVWATLMTVLIAVVTTVVITGTNNDMIASARTIFAPVAEVDIWVSANAPDSFATDALPQGLQEQVAGVPGVAQVSPGAHGFAVIGGTRVMLDGFSPGSADPLFRALDDPTRRDVLAGRGVVLSQNLGATLDVRVGDKLHLQTPRGPRQAEVLALVPYFSTVIGTVGIGLDQLRSWFDRPAVTTLQVSAADGVDHTRLMADIRHVVPEPNYVYDGRAALAGLEAPLRQSMVIANAVLLIVVFVAAVALFTTLTLSVLERRREIGVLRAIGANRRFTMQMVLAEAAGIGVVGGLLGLVIGLTDQWLYSLVSAEIMNFTVTFHPTPVAPAYALGAVAISLLGSVPPARRAARLNIIDAVASE